MGLKGTLLYDLSGSETTHAHIAAYPGAVVMVTHDEQFARRTTRAAWDIADGKFLVLSSLSSEKGPP